MWKLFAVLLLLLLLLLLLDRKVCVVHAEAIAAASPSVLTSCIAVLMIGPQGGGVVVVGVKLLCPRWDWEEDPAIAEPDLAGPRVV